MHREINIYFHSQTVFIISFSLISWLGFTIYCIICLSKKLFTQLNPNDGHHFHQLKILIWLNWVHFPYFWHNFYSARSSAMETYSYQSEESKEDKVVKIQLNLIIKIIN